MRYSSFIKTPNDATKEPMFFGQPVNVSRYDVQKYMVFEKLIEKQLSFFWRPEEIDITQDKIDFNEKLEEHEKHIFLSNLKYQTLLDSIQGRSPNVAFLQCVSIPELETWIETWSFSETVHSRSYTHIIRNIMVNPSEVFDDIVANEEIQKRATSVSKHYDAFIEYQSYYNLHGDGIHTIETNGKTKTIEITLDVLKKKLILCLASVDVLEGVRFFVSFACSFAFAERELMEGNAKIIKLIARDEALHLTGTQHMINFMRNGSEGRELKLLFDECKDEIIEIYKECAEQEKEWAKYLFQYGSMIGLNEKILCQYLEYITNIRLKSIGFDPIFEVKTNPIPWINNWLVSDNVQAAPQEVEITSYLVGQIDSSITKEDLNSFEL